MGDELHVSNVVVATANDDASHSDNVSETAPNTMPNSYSEPIVVREHPGGVLTPRADTVPNFNPTTEPLIAKDSTEMRRRAESAPADKNSAGSIAGAVTSQTALLVGVLYYFGWVRTQAMFAYFGVDTSLIGYGIPDYVLRSVDAAFRPFICAALIALTMLGIHRSVIRRALNIPGESRLLGNAQLFVVIVHLIGVGLVVLVIVGLLMPERIGRPLGTFLPASLIVSVALLGYASYLRSRYPKELAPTRRPAQLTNSLDQDTESIAKQSSRLSQSKWLFSLLDLGYDIRLAPRVALDSRIHALVLLVLGLLGMMWAVSLYANQVGTETASHFAAELPYQPQVVVYSTERIAIAGSGVKNDEIGQAGNKYHYRYSGLRLLIHSADRFILLPRDWQRGRDLVFILRDNESTRIDVGAW